MTTLRTITAFKSALAGGGARPNLFEVSIPSFPTAAGTSTWATTAGGDRKSTRLNSSHVSESRMPSSA